MAGWQCPVCSGFWVALMGLRRDLLEVAFANYRFWISFGLALGFLLIRSTNIDNFLLIAFAFLLVGILGYFMVELFDIIAVGERGQLDDLMAGGNAFFASADSTENKRSRGTGGANGKPQRRKPGRHAEDKGGGVGADQHTSHAGRWGTTNGRHR